MRPFAVREITRETCGGELLSYVVWWIKNPAPNSPFEQKTRFVRWLPAFVLIWLLGKLRYDGLVFAAVEANEVIGHIFYQRHDDALHVFSIATRGEDQGTGVAKRMTREFLLRAHKDASVKRIRLGAGGHGAIQRIWQHAIEGRLDLPFSLAAGNQPGWAYFVR